MVVVAWLAGACATVRVRPDIHKEGWLLVETEHIALRTDLPRDEAEWRARGLEQYWQVLAASYAFVVPRAAPPRGPFTVMGHRRAPPVRGGAAGPGDRGPGAGRRAVRGARPARRARAPAPLPGGTRQPADAGPVSHV
jgi:hypothetical protein